MATINYSKSQLISLIEITNKFKFKYLYVVDSYGSLSNSELIDLLNQYCNPALFQQTNRYFLQYHMLS